MKTLVGPMKTPVRLMRTVVRPQDREQVRVGHDSPDGQHAAFGHER